jgi:hypothetical protein
MKKYLLFFMLLFAFKNSYSQCVTTYGTIYYTGCIMNGGYVFDGNLLEGSGVYTETLVNYKGCDSIVTLYLTMYQEGYSYSTATICANQLPYLWNGSYLQEGFNEVIIPPTYGCDSIADIFLTVNQPGTSETDTTICPSQLPYKWNGQNFTQAGYYSVNINTPNPNDCDSVANLYLTVTPNSTSITNVTLCADKIPYTWNGKGYSATGTYADTIANGIKCDSIATLSLTVKPLSTITSFAPATAAKGQAVVITGTNFSDASAVSFGGIPATSFAVQSSTSIIAIVGTAAAGAVSVTSGCNIASLAGFSYNNMPADMGVGTTNPTSKFTIGGGDLQILDIGSGVILKSPNGNCWRVTIDNNGNLIRTAIPCP